MKRSWDGTKLTMDLEDGQPNITVDLAQFPNKILDDFRDFGAATKLRNYTAGKEADAARKALLAGIEQLSKGEWGATTERVELSTAEQTQVINAFFVGQRRMRGDTRPEEVIVAAFTALPADKREALLTKYAKGIKKAMNERLKLKKKGDSDDLS